MLDDPMLVDRAAAIVRDERLNAESALQRALDEVSALFDKVDDPYLRERKGDVADVVGRLCMNLRADGDPLDLFRDVEGPLVLVAEELSPSLIAQIDGDRLAALRHRRGKLDVSHGDPRALDAHSRRSPGVRHASGAHPAGRAASPSTDRAARCSSIRRPTSLADLEARSIKRRAYERSLDELDDLPSVTLDGTAIRIEANVELPEEAARARERGAEGIGLYRSEFLLAGTGAASLDEEAQYAVYRRLIEAMAGGRVTVRTFDVTEAQMGLTHGARADAIAARPARPAPQPVVRRECSRRSCGRCCARRRTARCASCSRSSPASRSCARRGPRSSRRREALRGARACRCPTCRSAS